MQNSFIWPIDRTLPGATTPSQSGPESNGNEEVLYIPQSSSIIRASASDWLSKGLTPLERCSQYILQLQPTGLS